MVSPSFSLSTSSERSTELAEYGWRYEEIAEPDGSVSEIQVPLTADEFLHPKAGYRLPNSTIHDQIAGDAKDILTRRYVDRSDAGVFRDLLIEWDIPDLRDHFPDTFVAFGIQSREQSLLAIFRYVFLAIICQIS